MRRRELVVLPAVLLAEFDLWAQQRNAAAGDPLIEAMRAEIERSKQLSVVGGQPVYFVECSIDDVHGLSLQASLGGLMNVRTTRFRIPAVSMRIGNMDFDNTNYVFSQLFQGTRYDTGQLPLENNIPAIRHNFWLALDRAYKTALEAIGRKRAALRNVTQSEVLPDFSPAPATQYLEPVEPWTLNEDLWKVMARQWSAIFKDYPEIYDSSVDVEISRDTYLYVNSEGSQLRTTEDLFYVRTRANSQAADGMVVRDSVTVLAMGAGRAPAAAAIEEEIRKVAINVQALMKAPTEDAYSGPVLFEATAAAQLMADLIGSQATVARKPVLEPGRPNPVSPNDFEGRAGSRVMPPEFTIVDDPTQKTYKGRPLMGFYPVDQEAVKPRPVVLVEKGTWKGYLATRQPTRETKESSGHARLKGSFGANQAFMSNLFVKAEGGLEPGALRQQFLKMIEQRGKSYGLIVRKLDFPSTGNLNELRQMFANAGGRPVPLPALVYRVYPDGREELVRGLRFRGMNVRVLRDIAAAGSDETQFDFIGNGAPLALTGAGQYIVGCSVVCPSILFEDLELDRPQLELPKLPVVPPPSMSGA